MRIPLVVSSLDEVLGQRVFNAQGVVNPGGVGGIVGLSICSIERHHCRHRLVGVKVGNESQ
ncbi:hypothetical protein SDC9_140856 [bioreactor metagenome]|uniref:Uncharacterized protein n=1 Tax=bioreactor metagenome TaxID=1076179 RepID=A0A645DW25_9ZZZZ